MTIDRRNFLKVAIAATTGTILGSGEHSAAFSVQEISEILKQKTYMRHIVVGYGLCESLWVVPLEITLNPADPDLIEVNTKKVDGSYQTISYSHYYSRRIKSVGELFYFDDYKNDFMQRMPEIQRQCVEYVEDAKKNQNYSTMEEYYALAKTAESFEDYINVLDEVRALYAQIPNDKNLRLFEKTFDLWVAWQALRETKPIRDEIKSFPQMICSPLFRF